MASGLHFKPGNGEIPTQPGVYRFLDANKRVLYVGKAKNLRSRLSNYFGTFEKLHERTQRMLQAANDVQWTIVDTEYEALQLEFEWIKLYSPPFNVRFKDDKSYPYLAISMGESVPRAFITRNRELRGVRYFGPYTQSWALRETLDTLLKVYPMRSCSAGVYASAKRNNRPCLLAEIGKCSAPCVSRIEPQDHRALAKGLGDFMGSGDDAHLEVLRQKMTIAAEEQNYELAAALRDDIHALEQVLERSALVFADHTDADVIGLARDELSAAVSIFQVRKGRIRGTRAMVVDLELERSDPELIEYLIQELYTPKAGVESQSVPRELLVPSLPADTKELATWLGSLRGSGVEIRVAQRGDKAKLAHTAHTNASAALVTYKTKRSADFTTRADALAGLQRSLGLSEAPLRIECYDVSHLSGTGTVGSMVVFEDGLPKRDHYRRFNLETADDTESIYQVLKRRLRYLQTEEIGTKFSYRPSLLLIDGGQPQLSAAIRAIDESGVSGISVASIAKRLEEIWVRGNPFPIILPRNSDELFLLQRVRDEAHRFAIAAQRNSRVKTISTALLEIPGLGEARARLLLRKFGSLKRIRLATVEEIAALEGFGPKLAQSISDSLGQFTESDTPDTPIG